MGSQKVPNGHCEASELYWRAQLVCRKFMLISFREEFHVLFFEKYFVKILVFEKILVVCFKSMFSEATSKILFG
jgi:hypothetical protein